MKKSYVKPQLWTESFQPSDAIAGPCDIDVGFGDSLDDAKMCAYASVWDELIFNSSLPNSPCKTSWDEGDDKGCYHIPTDSNKYFGS